MPLTIANGRFTAAMALAPLAGGEAVWDLWLAAPEGQTWRLARELGGVAATYPGRRAGGAELTPFLSRAGELSVRRRRPPRARCRAGPRAAGARAHRCGVCWNCARPGRAGRRAGRGCAACARAATAARARARAAARLRHGRDHPRTISLVGARAEDRAVEVVSIVRRRERAVLRLPRRRHGHPLDDQRPGRGGRGPVARFCRRVPSVFVHPEDHLFVCSPGPTSRCPPLRAMRGGRLITTRPAFNLLAARARRARR